MTVGKTAFGKQAFGKRVGGPVGADRERTTLKVVSVSFSGLMRQARGGARGQPLLRTALAGLILGFGGVTAGTGLVHANEGGGLFDIFSFFNPPQVRQAEVRRPPPRHPRRYSSLPDARRVTGVHERRFTPRPVAEAPPTRRDRPRERKRNPMLAAAPAAAPVSVATGPQSVCVRTCDGYLFPLGTLYSQRDVPVHQAACAAACPAAPTALYTLAAGQGDLDKATSLKGQPYLAAAWANVYRQKRVQNCHCREPGLTTLPLPIGSDPTARVGDVVATGPSAEVVTSLVRGVVKTEDYRTSRSLSQGARYAIDLQVGALQREASARAFQRTLRTADTGPIRTAEARYARMRMDAAGREAVPAPAAMKAPAGAPGFTQVRVMVPSPFKP